MRLSAPIHRLKRSARTQAREEAIPLHAALDRVAAGEGYASWSLLSARQTDAASDPATLMHSLAPGEMILIAARPLQGKTMFALQIAVTAIAGGHEAHFFSLDYTPRDVAERLGRLPEGIAPHATKLNVDCSDAISAGYVIEKLATAPRGTVVAVDYLQLLDQKRTNPPLEQQIRALAEFAKARGMTMAFVCQVDRNFDATAALLPDLADIRLPNPLDLSLFDRAVFLHGGRYSTLDAHN